MEPFLGQIMVFAGGFAPRGWALCDGQLLPINQNQALFSLLGTQYGGNGTTTFALPDLRSRVAVGQGQGPGLSNISIGERSGSENVTISTNEMPNHTHSLNASNEVGTVTDPTGKLLAKQKLEIDPENLVDSKAFGESSDGANVSMATGSIGNTGGSAPHTNIQPYNTCYYIIALQGIFPSRD